MRSLSRLSAIHTPLLLFLVLLLVGVGGRIRNGDEGGGGPDLSECALRDATHPIDEQIFAHIEERGVACAGLADDTTFLRRVFIDLIGRMPSPQEISRFLATSPLDDEARAEIIRTLIWSAEYADAFSLRWAYFLGDWIENSYAFQGKIGRDSFALYLQNAVRENRPLDELLVEMLTSNGVNRTLSGDGTEPQVAANLLVRAQRGEPFAFVDENGEPQPPQFGTPEHSRMVIQVFRTFMGMNLNCIQCHSGAGHLEEVNSWLSRKNPQDLWRLAAYLSDVEVPLEGVDPAMWSTARYQYDSKLYRVTDEHPRPLCTNGNGIVYQWPPFFILDEDQTPPDPVECGTPRTDTGNRRQALAEKMIQSIQFGRATVNRIWAELMGTGIFMPLDDANLDMFVAGTPVWEETGAHLVALLDELGADFLQDYDLRRLIETIATSRTYQLAAQLSTPLSRTERNEAIAAYGIRRMRKPSAPQLYEMIYRVLQDESFKPQSYTIWLADRGFESSPNSGGSGAWQSYGTGCLVERTAEARYSGSYGLRLTFDGSDLGEGGCGVLSEPTRVLGNQDFNVLFLLRNLGAEMNDGSLDLVLQQYDEGGNLIAEDFYPIEGSANWRWTWVPVSTDPYTTELRIGFLGSGNLAGAWTFDEVYGRKYVEPFALPSHAYTTVGSIFTYFGQPSRSYDPLVTLPNPVAVQIQLAQILMNWRGIENGFPALVSRWLADHPDAPLDRFVEDAYLSVLSRLPTGTEMDDWLAYLAEGSDPVENMEDLFWVLINTPGFMVIP